VAAKASDASPELVSLHVRIPKELFDKLLARRDAIRARDPMTSLSEAVRVVLEEALR
jgi:hypothetical protein